MILGTIEGISEQDFQRLKAELCRYFDEVRWKDESLVIKSWRDHGSVKPIFTRIAESIRPGRFGTLLYVGHGNVACFYFGSNRYVGRRFREPTPPDWWTPVRD